MLWGLRAFVARRQPVLSLRAVLLAGVGGAMTIAVLGWLASATGTGLAAAVFGASCVLVFTAPQLPFSQPINVVGGHLVAGASGLAVASVMPEAWWSMAIGVGVAISAMAALRVTHPPAGGTPIVVMTASASWSYLLLPLLAGSLVVVIMGVLFHRVTGTTYPARSANP